MAVSTRVDCTNCLPPDMAPEAPTSRALVPRFHQFVRRSGTLNTYHDNYEMPNPVASDCSLTVFDEPPRGPVRWRGQSMLPATAGSRRSLQLSPSHSQKLVPDSLVELGQAANLMVAYRGTFFVVIFLLPTLIKLSCRTCRKQLWSVHHSWLSRQIQGPMGLARMSYLFASSA